MNKTIRLVCVLAILLMPILAQARIFARWHTSMGSFTAELYDELVPITALNFRDLANDGFYNNLIFHRVIEGFMIQDGCPNGTGTGGPGYNIQDEFHPDLLHDSAGVLAMARTTEPNSAGSQYYITLAPQPHLDGGYAVFGRIIEGLENVMAIGSVPTNSSNRPITPVNIFILRMLDLHLLDFFPVLDEPVLLDTNTTQMFITQAYTHEATVSYTWFLNDELLPDDTFMIERTFESGNHTLRCNIASSDSIAFDAVWNIQVSSANEDLQAPVAEQISLSANPNPFGSNIRILCNSKIEQNLSLDVFNLRGQKVRSLQKSASKQGTWELDWNGCDDNGQQLPAGVYLLKMKADSGNLFRKISKLK
ncbi:MAG: peptidylprolyl isomerase [Candidatus Cloacimonetes bacterium]|jgi:cyclophilin family peptidyl-prolyl cis-trans isomerase|nr:peptidylprolyl isomerase [Candidatus Cloacimonadota bacterium]MDD2506169.1 peptidylprolyl isomerase [Candidatus Cloacimonadota bacterium]MDD4147638.1 peptidylprolyl isomerase [Candidatus Cloacimonadota bacterium]MDD4559339.1 peptidylprolyl isomerase [Candidatus Cloacimonadota bacterium]